MRGPDWGGLERMIEGNVILRESTAYIEPRRTFNARFHDVEREARSLGSWSWRSSSAACPTTTSGCRRRPSKVVRGDRPGMCSG